MWPHSFSLAAGDAVVRVGTDDSDIAALLARWVVPDLTVAPPTPDFGLELHPPRPEHRAQPRALPSLQHGTSVIGRTTDTSLLRDGLLRTIASIATPPVDGRVRMSGLPLLVDGGVVLAPPEVADRGSLRRLRGAGHSPLYVPSVTIDPSTLLVHIPAPFGSDRGEIVAPLLHWWLPLHADDVALAAAQLSVGQVVAHAVHRLAPPWFDDETDGAVADDAGTAALEALVALVSRLPPEFGKFDR